MRKIWPIFLGILFFGSLVFFMKPSEQRTQPTPSSKSFERQAPVGQPNPQAFAELLSLGDILREQSQKHLNITKNAPFAGATISPALHKQFQNFADLAKQEASNIDAANGPHDLACIFRGMSEDALRKLAALKAAKTNGPQAKIWADALYLFTDVRAVLIPGADTAKQQKVYKGETCAAEKTKLEKQ